MKNFFTLTLCFFTLSLTAQIDCPNPYDGNGDGNVSIGDFLEMLAVFGDTDTDSDGVWDSLDYCVDLAACNYANDPSETCAYIDVLGVCGGGCEGDGDDDGVCDSEDDCVGVLDECGVCNGPGPTEVVIESITILYDSVYAEAIDNWFVFEIGADTLFNYFCEPVLTPLTDDNIHEAVDLWLSDEASSEATYGHISDWDVSSVTDMSQMFEGASSFNGDISAWDVSSVTNMRDMFYNASSFDSDISLWNVSGVTNMAIMFRNAINFNGDLSAWDVSSVTSMPFMFSYAQSFNGNISSWDVSSVANMYAMFAGASSFNSDISSWDVSSVTQMAFMFENASSFNSDISSWDVSNVTEVTQMFQDASSFNRDISAWDVSSVTSMTQMFDNASALSEENQCAIHTSFSSNSNWTYDWSEFCPPALFISCGDDIGHDGYDYSTVLIGEQCWFSENCRYLPAVSPSSEGSETDPYYYVYGYEGSTVAEAKATGMYVTFGVLYNWPAVMTEGICPSGWHIPTDGEFTELTDFLGGEDVAGGKMKEAGYDHWNSPNAGATNSSGWTGLPGGCRYSGGVDGSGDYGYWWSASESGSYSWKRTLVSYSDAVVRDNGNQLSGMSARCVIDYTDECGVLNGDNSTCADCCGVPNGDGSTCDGDCGACNDNSTCLDECGVPNGDNSTCFTNCGDDIEHESYNYSTVQIGDQCWFSENCRYLPEVSPSNEGSETDPYYYVYDYQGADIEAAKATANYGAYGVLYNWPAVMTEGVCPSGWHVPSDGEWQIMEISLGMIESEASSTGWRGSPVGDYIKSTSEWHNGGNGSNSSGFNGLPSGLVETGVFNSRGYYGGWRSSSESGSDVWERGLSYINDNVQRNNGNRDIGVSARCVIDYTDECGVTNGDNSTCLDDCGVPNGDNTTCADECGVPNGDNSSCADECGVPYGNNSTCVGCDGVPNSGLVYDECEVCGGDNSTCADDCGVPYGDNTTCTFELCGDQIGHGNYAYSTVQIGDQCWFAENCRYLPVVSPSSAVYGTSPYYYVYGYEGTDVAEAKATDNYETYGVLYNWPAVMTYGICPSGWHIPSRDEFIELWNNLGGQSVAGYAMKSTSGWNNGGNGSNSSGWTGLPGGRRTWEPNYASIGVIGYWWSTTDSSVMGNATVMILGSSNFAEFGSYGSYYGFSARCVRD